MIKKLLGFFAAGTAAASPATSHHVFGNGIFSLDAPAMFARATSSETFQLVAPDDVAAIAAAAYAKAEGSLDAFCTHRLSAVEDFYRPVFEAEHVEAAQASGRIQEFEGTWPGDSRPTYYVVACLQTGDVFVSIGIVTTRQHFEAHRSRYREMLRSIRPGA